MSPTPIPPSDPDFVDFESLAKNRLKLLSSAYCACREKKPGLMREVERFTRDNAAWLPDYCLFMALKERFGMRPLWLWPDAGIRSRADKSMAYYSGLLAGRIHFYGFLQYLFFSQWRALKAYANALGLRIFGDLPIYVSGDSADVWSNPGLFCLKADLSPSYVAGVPPDLYSETGQLWGNPVYRYAAHRRDGFSWWLSRVSHSLSLFDVLRIDHFRGFSAFYQMKAEEKTALNGRFVKGPGKELVGRIVAAAPPGAIIPEDLGIIDDKVRALQTAYDLPGMKVLVFGMCDPESEHFPSNYAENVVAYTSTHDSEPFRALFEKLPWTDRAQAASLLDIGDGCQSGLAAFYAVSSSRARMAIAPMQDALSLGADATMNRPSVPDGNWRWRVRSEAINGTVARDLKRIAEKTGRCAD